ncbi:MAG: hypothetical protein KI785_11140 [Devosiaceae bacterium]|nr:hypothetical protein [Devosiaceae bacterium MH13]
MIEGVATLFADHGDVGHLALFLWAVSASGLAGLLVRDLVRSTARYEAFVMAIARLNAMLEPHTARPQAPAPRLPAASGTWPDPQPSDPRRPT